MTADRRFATASDAEADGVLAVIGWLGVPPEQFVDDSNIAGVPLPPAADGVIRVDMALLADLGHDGSTLLLLLSDNGGNPKMGGYNNPLRGAKSTSFECGVRNRAILWGDGVLPNPTGAAFRYSSGLFHVSDADRWLLRATRHP